MLSNAIPRLLDRLRRSELVRKGGEQTDGQLLKAFVGRRDAQALEALVRRHAPMVWGVCRRTLANHHDAEDAFQATFLVLLRRAASLRSPELLANWLYGVALKTARKAKQMAAKRSVREPQVSPTPEPSAVESRDCSFGPEQLQLLDEELSRLPEKYRAAIVLCDLEGSSRAEAARRLRKPEGTVASRLARGREMLARRLTRRGLDVSATSVAAALPRQAALGSVPAVLLTNTIKTTALIAAGEVAAAGAISGQVATLTEAVLRAMALTKRKATIVVFLIAALVLSAGLVAHHLLDNRPIENSRLPPDPDRPGQADYLVLVVSASYPGANAAVVADVVGGSIEGVINHDGAQGLVRIESTSDNDGRYTAHLYFKAETDPESAMKVVKTRIWQAEPLLPDVVLKEKVSVTVGKAAGDPNEVAIAVIDLAKGGDGVQLKKAARAVVKRLEAEHALTNPQVFPGGDDVKELSAYIDHTKCASLSVTPTEVFKTLEAAVPAYHGHPNSVFGIIGASAEGKAVNLEELKKVVVRGKVTLGDVAHFRELYGPATAYRVDNCVAFRITGTPPEGKSVAEAATKCVELAEPEAKRVCLAGPQGKILHMKWVERWGFAVKNLSAK
jgi:RNA polymerase sigma factor (sigma-70 family)